jgi:adenine-specific DNA-methyltransferase
MEYSNRVKDNLKKDEHGTFYYRGGSHGGKKLSRKVYLQESGIFPRDVWNDIPYVRANTVEYQGFTTQKPERLLKRIILASSNSGDIVADFFCGTGTTLSVAEKLDRRWIGSDIMKNSINITKKRILNIYSSYNLYSWKMKYELHPKPFKLMGFKSKIGDLTIPTTFLKKRDKSNFIINDFNSQFSINIVYEENSVIIQLTNYIIPKMELIQEKLVKKISDFSDWIDSWAVDYNYNGYFFNTSWISFRTYNKRKVNLRSKPYYYEKQGEYDIAVKVINIFNIEITQIFKVYIN